MRIDGSSYGCVVIGAGVAGLAAAGALRDAGIPVVLLDKGCAAGGRLATRRVEGAVFDHGAQFFTARDAGFARTAAAWRAAGVARPWFDDALCATAGMSSIARHLAAGLDVGLATTVTAVARGPRGYVVTADDGRRWEAAAVVLTAPVPQSLALLDAGGVALDDAVRARLAAVTYERCLAGLFEAPWPAALPAHGVARVDGDTLSWLASNRAKGLCAVDAVTAHARADWSLARWSHDDAAVLAALASEVARYTGGAPRPVALKRWRYAKPTRCLDGPVVVRDGGATLLFAGDALHRDGGRVEGAARSGLAAAAALS
jgi:predicted NAD/FAD-dependent oxidoreductase